MHEVSISELEWAAWVLRQTRESFDIIFDNSPVMMHAVDREFRIVKVNHRWLETMGYEEDEVLGWSPPDFVTEETRTRVVKDILPRFWRTGSDRSIGLQFVRKDGRIIDLLLDAEVSPAATGNYFAYAALHDSYDPIKWEQASTTLRTLKELTRVQGQLEGLLSTPEDGNLPQPRGLPDQPLETLSLAEILGPLLESIQDIPINLRSLTRIHEEWLNATVEQQRELFLVAKSINRTLEDLADTLAAQRAYE